MPKRAFTLVELLVTICIVAILAGMIMPAIARGREKGRQTKCTSNLKQIMVASTLYMQVYEVLPHYALWPHSAPPVDLDASKIGVDGDPVKSFTSLYNGDYVWYWIAFIMPYHDENMIYMCPTDSMWGYNMTEDKAPYGNNASGWIAPDDTQEHMIGGQRGEKVNNPSKKIYIADSRFRAFYMGDADYSVDNVTETDRLCDRHIADLNCAFVDTHIEPLTVEEITSDIDKYLIPDR